MKKFHIIYGLFWILTAILVVFSLKAPPHQSRSGADLEKSSFIRGSIMEVHDQDFFVRLSDERNTVIKTQLNDYYFNNDYQKGDKVSVYITELENGEKQYDIADYYHSDGLLIVFVIFCGLAIWTAGKKGFYSIISVIISLILFYAIVLNAVKLGVSVILAGVIYVLLITILTIPLIHGFNKKGLSAIIAVNIGYILGFILTYFFTDVVKIGNTPSEDFRILFQQFPEVDIHQILIISLFLGAAGALIDVAVSICSAIFEGMKEHPGLTFSKTYKLGMNVGKDILGSMINTLLLAYIAASLPFLILMTLAKYNNMHQFLNYDFIALELTRIFIGAASIVLLIPITSIAAAYLVQKKSIMG
ncbi:YibE/F family protein [Patescibacteria group bacterium]|nr:YibE/F family protein [Patescibacteria group bacterium]MBU1685317.1 YibE/F family protein [Patescibacteria group bacterium]MBU1938951.1 YibE/F family protein [Patescibacteria group bacterium]